METHELTRSILENPSWRDGINYLCNLLTCTRYQAAAIIASAMSEGYLLA